MKKFLKFMMIATVAIITVAFASCSKDDDDEPSKSDVVGTWVLSQVSTDNGANYISWPFEKTTASFKSDGTYYGKGYFGTGSGTWKQKGKTITTYVDGEVYLQYDVIELGTSTCTLKMSMSGSSSVLYIKCIKQ